MALAALLPVLRLTGKVPYGAWTCCLGNSFEALQDKAWSTHRMYLGFIFPEFAGALRHKNEQYLNTSPPSRFLLLRPGWMMDR